MKKLLFGITSLTLGGAERVLVDVANTLVSEYDITVFTLYPQGELEASLDSKIKRISLYPVPYHQMSKWKKLTISLCLLLFRKHIYQKYIKQDYDTEIAFLEGPITRLFSAKNPKVKKIVWIHNDIGQVFGTSLKSKGKAIYDKSIYTKYQKLVFVSKDNLEAFKRTYPEIEENKLTVIYNYLNAEVIVEKANKPIEMTFSKETCTVLTVARLVKQKGLDRFIKVHANLVKQGIKHIVFVIGEGPERENLEEQIRKEGVEDTFILLGKQENPYPYIKQTDIFCLLSYYEGYGMVLEEAKILKKSIIITDTAAREAVVGYERAHIVDNNEEGIYEGLRKAILAKEEEIQEQPEQANYENEILLEQIKEIL